ncbi:MAG TPA: alanine racemase [Acidimicrobiales bacterium]|nr:alanine racemase [Acidimicrobiales bacterium]
MTPARDELVARVTANLAVVHERIASTGRDPSEVTVVAVCKSFGPEAPAAAAAAGLGDVAENYAAELVAHHDALGDTPLVWHFLGALQRNKLARLAPRVAVYESLATPREAEGVGAHAPGARCYVQVDVTGRPGRAGCAPGEVPSVLAAARGAGLAVEGLMCVASPDPAAARAEFASLRRAADALGLPGCSMGMSGDLEAACRAGSTAVRLGTALFGARPSRPSAPLA